MGVFELVEEHFKMQQGGTWEKQKAKVQKEKYQGNNLLEMLQEDKDLIERLSKKDRIKKETNTKTSDNTKVNTKNKPELISKSARNKTDKEIAEERKAKIEESVKYQDVPFTQDNWREVLAKETQSTGDKFRVSLEPNFFDDYLNPAAMIGSMASNLGQAPLQAQQQDSYMPYVTSIGMPLAVGAMAGIGTQNTGQFVNNLANPLAGTGDLVNNLGNKYLPNAHKLNPNAFKLNEENLYRQIGESGYNDAMESGVIRSADTKAYPNPYFAEAKDFNKLGSTGSGATGQRPDFIAEIPMQKNGEPLAYPDGKGFWTSGEPQIPLENATLYKKDWLQGYKQVEVPKPTPELSGTSRNLEDLNYAKEWSKEYGYQLPENLERVAQSDELTNRTIRGLMDRHNTFVRGVSTNWDEIEKRNPEILRHLEGKGFDLSTKEGTKQAAEYMSTHVPIDTGYGRASLNDQVFDRGQDAIYTSNSIPTAEGYTYGQGYITKVKKPTDFSSANRQDWITQNNPTYYKNSLPKSRSYSVRDLDNLTNEKINDLLSQKRIDEADYGKILNYWNESKKIKKDLMGRYKINESTPDDVFDNYLDELNKEKENLSKNLFYEDYSNKILRTEKKTLNESTLQNDLLPIFRQFPESKANFKDFVKNNSLNDDILNSAEGDKWFRKFATENNYLTNDNPYAHYLHIGTPGEKILEPVKSWEITPDIWKNKSRAHTNEYSKKLSALSTLPIAGASYLATQGQEEPKKFQQGGKFTENEKKFLEEVSRLKLI